MFSFVVMWTLRKVAWLAYKADDRKENLLFGSDYRERASYVLDYAGFGSRRSWSTRNRHVLGKEGSTAQCIQELGLFCFFAAKLHT
jgi:hypothetical protein